MAVDLPKTFFSESAYFQGFYADVAEKFLNGILCTECAHLIKQALGAKKWHFETALNKPTNVGYRDQILVIMCQLLLTLQIMLLQLNWAKQSCHSVLEQIWIKGSYLSQWLPQGEMRPPKESKSWWIEIFHGGSH